MLTTTSRDGTSIAYDRRGDGPALILVGGGATDRSENSAVADALAEHFSVFNYDRRGRGSSEDTLPYAVEREVEDLAAVIDEAGGRAHLYGASSGGALALEAAACGLQSTSSAAIESVTVYEIPYNLDATWPSRWRTYTETLASLLAAGQDSAAFTLFMRLAETPEDDIAAAQRAPFWRQLAELAPTLAYDAACLGDGQPPTERLSRITCPVLVATGVARPGPEWVQALGPAADAIAASIPRAVRTTLERSDHIPDGDALAAAIRDFATSHARP